MFLALVCSLCGYAVDCYGILFILVEGGGASCLLGHY